MDKNRILALVLIVLIAAGLVWFAVNRESPTETDRISSFVECANAGFPVMESYPRQCRDDGGNLFIEDIPNLRPISYTNASSDDIVVDSLTEENNSISSPLVITGMARGPWYFEASFPILLTDWDGRIIAQGYATAQDDWMTTDFVPFTSVIEFETPAGPGGPINRGTLILQRDNPSGLPQYDGALEIPVVFE